MPFFKAGTRTFRLGNDIARNAKKRHHPETKANCMMVKVIGLGKVLRIDFDEVLVKAELKYQTRHRIWKVVSVHKQECLSCYLR